MRRRVKPVRFAGPVLVLGLAILGLLALQERNPPAQAYYFAPGSPPGVALTFETLWSDAGLEEVLQALEREGVRATFFITGTWLQRFPGAAASILQRGHEIGSHSMSHRTLLSLEEKELLEEVGGFHKLAQDILEYRPRLFRPPGGGFTGLSLEAARKAGYRTVLWSVDSYDWISLSGEEIATRVAERAHGGAIINFRVGARFLPEALPRLARNLRELGYEPVTASELLADCP